MRANNSMQRAALHAAADAGRHLLQPCLFGTSFEK